MLRFVVRTPLHLKKYDTLKWTEHKFCSNILLYLQPLKPLDKFVNNLSWSGNCRSKAPCNFKEKPQTIGSGFRSFLLLIINHFIMKETIHISIPSSYKISYFGNILELPCRASFSYDQAFILVPLELCLFDLAQVQPFMIQKICFISKCLEICTC